MKTTVAYLAGFFDADGCVVLATRKLPRMNTPGVYHRLRLQVAGVDPTPLQLFQQRWGGSLGSLQPPKPTQRRYYQWVLDNNQKVHHALEEMLPYLTVKRRQARLALRYSRECYKGNHNGWEGRAHHVLLEREFLNRERYKRLMSELKHVDLA